MCFSCTISPDLLKSRRQGHFLEALEKSKLTVRWLVLLLLSLLMIGNYYCYDNPSALYSQLAAEFSGTPHFDF